MNAEQSPRPLRLKPDDAPGDTRPWRIRTPDGRVRGPLGLAQLQTMLDVGVLKPDAQIGPAEYERWQPITEHEVWTKLQRKVPAPVTRPVAVENLAKPAAPAAPAPAAVCTVLPVESTAAMAERLRGVRRSEARKLARGVWLDRAVRVLGWGRAALLFLLFLTLGDFVNEVVPANLGVVRLGAMLALLTFGVGGAAWFVFKEH